ncbi:MAG: diguanylate cyclase [Blastomonas sp.]|nr:diguanylate cyclase [Blastomonas sp.]
MWKSFDTKRHFGAIGEWSAIGPLAAVYLLMLVGAGLGLHGIVREVDRSDAVRATEAVNAAFHYQLGRLEMVTMNNAVYTAAWKAVGGTTVDRDWAIENWTVAPPDLPGHYGILLVDSDGSPLVGTRAGRPISATQMTRMAALVGPIVRKLHSASIPSVRGLVSTDTTPYMVAAANVVPEPADRLLHRPGDSIRSLVLIHPINNKLLTTMNETIGGEKLTLGPVATAGETAVIRADVGPPVVLAWQSREPGRAAMLRSLKTIIPVFVLVTVFSLIAVRKSLASNKALNAAAKVDYLTQLPNRAAFADQLDLRAQQKVAFHLGLIDLDGFKQVNDKHGHLVGDKLLQAFGDVLRNAAGPQDIVARLGGDEFAFLTSNTDAAERLTLRLQLHLSSPLRVDSMMLQIGASVGLARGDSGIATEEVMGNADADLYARKRMKHARKPSKREPRAAVS